MVNMYSKSILLLVLVITNRRREGGLTVQCTVRPKVHYQ